MDQKDKQILQILKQNSSLTTRQIARKTKIPITTVHNRIKKLKSQGIIKKFTIQIDNSKIGKSFSAIILISTDYKLLRELKKDQHILAKEISHFEEVEKIDIVTGETDIVIRISVKDVHEFDEFLFKKLQKIQGIDRTKSLVIIHEKK